ncbi:MAG: conjugative transposon protein TraN, partial [Bacteroidales bacterium]|nr:conjugative transposon protein TraN [Bacteroidales bacterium]
MKIKILIAFFLCIASASLLCAQETASGLELLTVNDQVTTVITATEPIRFVDISTGKVAGDQPLSNTLRLKPKEGADVNADGDVLAVVTVITERYRVQYGLIYTTRMNEAVTEKTILQTEVLPYNNPAVSMSTEEMARFARRVWDSPAKYRNVGARKHHMNIRLNNIYSAGEYFFIDFSVQNRTNIRFDIDQIRVKVEDKRQTRAANCQSIEIAPAIVLESANTFLHGYRNVLVLKKLTFPNDKVLTIEMSEKQISGRTITLSIDYED